MLAELIETMHAEPTLSSAQLVERWRDRPEHARLEELAAVPLPDLNEAVIGQEVAAAVGRLIAEAGPERRLDELIEKAGAEGLDEDEKRELRELQARVRATPRPVR